MAFRRWIWCRDLATGHHIDVDARQLDRLVRAKAVQPVPDYPVNEGQNAQPRPAKHAVDLTARRSDPAPADETPPAGVEAEAATAPTPAPPRRSSRTATAESTAGPNEGAGK